MLLNKKGKCYQHFPKKRITFFYLTTQIYEKRLGGNTFQKKRNPDNPDNYEIATVYSPNMHI